MTKATRSMWMLLRLLPLLLLAGGGTQAWAGSADIEGRIAYSISGDSITVEIERIANNTSNTTTGTLYVTVWMTANSDLFSGGYRVARHRITGSSNGQLEPGEYFGDIRWTLDYEAPPPGAYYVHFFTSQHPEPNTVLDSRTFPNTVDVAERGGPADIEGRIAYNISGDRITVEIERIANNTSSTTTGTLYVTVKMTTINDLFSRGHQVARHRITGDSNGQLEPGHYFGDIQWNLAYQRPPAGTYYVHFWTSQHPEPNVALDSRTFANTVEIGGGGRSDDHGNTRSAATRVALPSTTTGTIDPGTDTDWFRFVVAARGTVVMESSGDLDTIGTLFDASGNSIVQNDDGAGYPNFRIERALDAGTYYIRVHSHQTATGGYTLHLRTANEGDDGGGGGGGDDHGNTRSAATRVALPSTTAGTIDPGEDEDYFRFEVAASSTVVMESGGGLDVVGTLFNVGGNRIALDDDGGAGSNFRMERTLDPGTYYVRVHSYWAVPGAYTLHLRTAGGGDDGGGAAGDDHGNTRSTATRIALPSTTSGAIDPGNDTDHFRFVVPARGVVVMESTGGLDTVGTLFNVRGGRIVQDDDGAGYPNFRIERTLDAGTYYVRVHTSGTATGAYALHLRGGGADGGDGLRISTATGSAVEPFQQVSLAVEGGTADADYDILIDLSGTGAFEAEDTIEVAPVGAAEDRLLMAAPLPEALAKGNAARLFAVRVRERGGETMSTPLTLTLGETNVPASLGGQPTAILDVVLKEAFESLDDPLLTVEAAAIAPGRSVHAARALGLNTSYSDAQAEALLRSLFGISLVEPGAAASPDRNAAVRCGASAPDALCDAYRRLANCVGDAMDAGIVSGESLDQCARSGAAAVVEAWDDYGEKIRTAGNFLGPAAPRLARNLGVGKPAQQLHDLNATVRQVVGATKTLRTITERTEDLRDAYEAMRDATQALTEGNAELVTEAGQEIAADGVDDTERDAYFALVEEADRHYSDAATIEELEGVYTGAADVAETLGTVADGGDGTSGGATCGPDYEEFPVDDKTSTCVWESLVEWNCYAGSRQVSHPDLGGANACLYDSLDFPQPDGTCRENYAKVTFLGRETCRWTELGADKAAWFTLEKGQGVKSPRTSMRTPPTALDGDAIRITPVGEDQQSGSIEYAGNVDEFEVVVNEPGFLTIYTTGELDTYGTLLAFDALDGFFSFAYNDDSGEGANFKLKHHVDAGTYRVEVRGYCGIIFEIGGGEYCEDEPETGAYSIRARFAPATSAVDHGDSPTDATELLANGWQSGRIDAGELSYWGDDFFRITISEFGRLSIESSGDVVGRLWTDVGRFLNSTGSRGVEWIVAEGTYYLTVSTDWDERDDVIYTVQSEFTPHLDTRSVKHLRFSALAAGSRQGRIADGGPADTVDVFLPDFDFWHKGRIMNSRRDDVHIGRAYRFHVRDEVLTQEAADDYVLSSCRENGNNCELRARWRHGQCLVTAEARNGIWDYASVLQWVVVPEPYIDATAVALGRLALGHCRMETNWLQERGHALNPDRCGIGRSSTFCTDWSSALLDHEGNLAPERRPFGCRGSVRHTSEGCSAEAK